MTMTVTMTMNGERYVVLPESTFDRMVERLGDVKLPDLPEANERGRRPARETGRAILARKLIKRRVTAGWTQGELAERAGVRVETISRLEGGKHRPHPSTIVKLDAAFERVGV
jgi:DNA-binding XRE family transcriptional regulator